VSAIALVFILLVAITSWCCKGSDCLPPPPSGETDEFAALPFSDLAMDIYVDATLSMQGFVRPGPETRYIQTLQRLENATIKGWLKSEVNFYKFGNHIATLLDRQQFLESVARLDFYNDAQYRGRTHLEDIVDKATPGNLTIIVTDLFEENSDLNALERELKTKYILSGSAIGILGVKSAFDGIIYDIGLSKATSPHKGLRPFYVLVLGNHKDVARLIEQMQVNESGDEHFALFSQNIANQSAALRKAKVTESSKLVEDDFLQLGPVDSPRARQFTLQGDPLLGSFLLSDIQLCPMLHTTPFEIKDIEDRSKFEQEIMAYRYECGEGMPNTAATDQGNHPKGAVEPFAPSQAGTNANRKADSSEQGPPAQPAGQNQKHQSHPVQNQDAFRALKVEIKADSSPDKAGSTKTTDQCASLTLKSVLEPALLPGSGIYRFDVTLRPKPNAYVVPGWYSEWNMDPAEIESWKRGAKLDTGTTLNLKSFLESLWTTTLQVHHPSVLKLHIYIKKR